MRTVHKLLVITLASLLLPFCFVAGAPDNGYSNVDRVPGGAQRNAETEVRNSGSFLGRFAVTASGSNILRFAVEVLAVESHLLVGTKEVVENPVA